MTSDFLELEACRVNLATREVWRQGKAVSLSEHEAALLAWLVARPDRAVARRELLAEVWRYHPGVRSRAVDNTVQRLRAKIEADPARPRHVETVRGVGYRFRPPPAAPADRPLGRDAVVDRLVAMAERPCPLVSVVGLGGIGKTTVAREVLRRTGVPRTALWVDLVACRTADDVARRAAEVLGCVGGAQPADAVAHALAGLGPALVVLDNAEHVVEPLGALLPTWRGNPELCLMATSRTPLHLPDEAVVALGPLDPEASRALLAARAQVPDGDRDALLALLDGIPLAIELAARWLAVAPADHLVRSLGPRVDSLHAPAPGESSRHASLSRVIDATVCTLPPPVRVGLGTLAIFEDRFDLVAATAVLEAVELPALPTLGALVDRALVCAQGGVFRLLVPVRHHALDLLDDETRPAALDAHASAVLQLGKHAAERFHRRDADDARAALHRLRPDLCAVIQRSLVARPDRAVAGLFALHPLSMGDGQAASQLAEVEAVAAKVTAPRDVARIAYLRAYWLDVTGRRSEARDVLRAARILPHDDTVLRLDTDAFLARVHVWLAEDEAGLALADERLPLAVSVGATGAAVGFELALAQAAWRRRDVAASELAFTRARQHLDRADSDRERPRVERALAMCALMRGDVDAGLAGLRRYLNQAETSGQTRVELLARAYLAVGLLMAGDARAAAAHVARGEALGRRLDDAVGRAYVRFTAGLLALQQGELGRAEGAFADVPVILGPQLGDSTATWSALLEVVCRPARPDATERVMFAAERLRRMGAHPAMWRVLEEGARLAGLTNVSFPEGRSGDLADAAPDSAANVDITTRAVLASLRSLRRQRARASR